MSNACVQKLKPPANQFLACTLRLGPGEALAEHKPRHCLSSAVDGVGAYTLPYHPSLSRDRAYGVTDTGMPAQLIPPACTIDLTYILGVLGCFSTQGCAH